MGGIVCYDCTDMKSFENAETWLSEFKEAARENAPIMLIANKCDLKEEAKDVVNNELAEELAKKYKAIFMETSAHTGENIEKCFETICEEILVQRFPKLLPEK